MLMRQIFSVLLGSLAIESVAHAYIDPGTGSLILQAVLGGVAGAAFVIKLYWGKIKALFSRKRPGA